MHFRRFFVTFYVLDFSGGEWYITPIKYIPL